MATPLHARTAADWERILIACGVKSATAKDWAPAFADEVQSSKFDLGEEELDDFLGQVLHESSMLERMSEDLDYSADRIRLLGNSSPAGSRWRSLVPRADELAHKPEALGNALYANRNGNGDEASGDGYKFRARSPIGLTFFENYKWVGEKVGQDLTVTPEIAEQKHFALQITIAYWMGRVPDSCINNIMAVTKRINGGTIGIAHRKRTTELAALALKNNPPESVTA
jgi:putative chitinase